MNAFFTEHTPWGEGDLEMRTLTDGLPPAGFDCGAEEQNRFFYDRAWADACRSVSATHTLYIKGVLAGYVTLLGDRIKLGPRERPRGVSYQLVPALKIGQLGIDRRFAGRGLGKYLVAYGIELALRWRAVIGCRYVTVDAEPHLVPWYEGQGFRKNKEEQEFRRQLARERGRSSGIFP